MSQPQASDLATVLARLLKTEGHSLLSDRPRLQVLLREALPDYPRSVNLLLVALDAGVPGRLRETGSSPAPGALAREAEAVVDEFGVSENNARLAVEAWAAGLAAAAPRVDRAAAAPVAEVGGASPSEILARIVEGVAPIQIPAEVQAQPAAGPAPPPPVPPPMQPRPAPTLREPSTDALALDLDPLDERPLVRPAGPKGRAGGGLIWAILLPLGAAAVAAGLWWTGYPTVLGGGQATGPKPIEGRLPGGPSDDRLVLLEGGERPVVEARRVDGDPNSLAFGFRLPGEAGPTTFRVSLAFPGGGQAGTASISASRAGQEAATGPLPVTRAVQANGYLGATVAGRLAGPLAAPSLCVTVLAGRNGSYFDLADGGGTFVAYGLTPAGLCDASTVLGRADLR